MSLSRVKLQENEQLQFDLLLERVLVMLGAAGRELLFVDYATDVDDDDFVCYREQVASLKAVDPRESKVVVMAELLLYQPDYDKQVLVEFEFILWVTQAEKLLQVHLHLADLGKLG